MFYLGTENHTKNLVYNKIAYDIVKYVVDSTCGGGKIDLEDKTSIVEMVLPEFYMLDIEQGYEIIESTLYYLKDLFFRFPLEINNYVIYACINIALEVDKDDDGTIVKEICEEAFSYHEKEVQRFKDDKEFDYEYFISLQGDEHRLIADLFYDWDFMQAHLLGANGAEGFYELIPFDIREKMEKSKSRMTFEINEEIDLFDLVLHATGILTHEIKHKKMNVVFEKLSYYEKDLQLIMGMFYRTFFDKYNVSIDRECDTDRGLIDLKYSVGSLMKVLLELKTDKNDDFMDNLRFQLPTYMVADKAKYGVFVLVITKDEHFDKISDYKQLCEDSGKEFDKTIAFIYIDARKKETGSNVKSFEEVSK